MKLYSQELLARIQTRLERLYGIDNITRLMERIGVFTTRYCVDHKQTDAQEKRYWDQTDSLLISYGDIVQTDGEKPLTTLQRFLATQLHHSIEIVHLLPFFPYSSDDGFAVIDYHQVDPLLGDWQMVQTIGYDFDLMFDLVLNHVSSQSEWFRHFQAGLAPARDYFITVEAGTDLSAVVRPRTSPLLTPVQTPSGEQWAWTTFSADQIDLNFANPDVLFEFLDILLSYVCHGARIIRLDAIAYLWKQIGTNCLNLPQTHEVIKLFRDLLDMLAPNTLLLTETNLPHEQNISYFGEGDEAQLIYQFSLPPLLLHALQTGSSRYLTAWADTLQPLPPGCTYLNFTASHDGIGVRPLEGLVPDQEVNRLVERVLERGGRVSKRTSVDGQEQPYELNITYYSALADPQQPEYDFERFLCSQMIMLSLQGIPAIYFHSLTATPNDQIAVERTGQARAINRRRWREAELNALLNEPTTMTARVFSAYRHALQLRRMQPAFHPDSQQQILKLGDPVFALIRTAPEQRLLALANLTAETQQVQLADFLATNQPWDLIANQALSWQDESVQLSAYQTCWIPLDSDQQ